jgi:hypothetical protein
MHNLLSKLSRLSRVAIERFPSIGCRRRGGQILKVALRRYARPAAPSRCRAPVAGDPTATCGRPRSPRSPQTCQPGYLPPGRWRADSTRARRGRPSPASHPGPASHRADQIPRTARSEPPPADQHSAKLLAPMQDQPQPPVPPVSNSSTCINSSASSSISSSTTLTSLFHVRVSGRKSKPRGVWCRHQGISTRAACFRHSRCIRSGRSGQPLPAAAPMRPVRVPQQSSPSRCRVRSRSSVPGCAQSMGRHWTPSGSTRT